MAQQPSTTTTLALLAIKKLKAEEAFYLSALKHVREQLKYQQVHQQEEEEAEEIKQEEEPPKKLKKKNNPKTTKNSSSSKKEVGSINSFGGGKRPIGYVSFIVNYHHGRDEVEDNPQFRAPVSRLELFYRESDNVKPTYQQMINAVCQDKTLKEPIRGNTRNFIITRRVSIPDAAFGRVIDQAPVAGDYDKYHIATGYVYDIWPYQVVNNAKPIITITAIVDSNQVIVDDAQLICTSKPWINELVKKKKKQGSGYLSYAITAFGKLREDGLRFRNMPDLSFSSKNSAKSGYVIYGMSSSDREIYDANREKDQQWFDDTDDSEGMSVQGLPLSFFASSSSSSKKTTKEKEPESKKRKRQEEEKKDSDSDSDSGDELPNPKRPKSQREEYDEDNIDEAPWIVDGGCTKIYCKTVSILVHYIGSFKNDNKEYPTVYGGNSESTLLEPFAFREGATKEHLDAFVSSRFLKGDYQTYTLGMGLRVSDDKSSYVLKPEPLVVDNGIYHYYMFSCPTVLPIIAQVRVAHHIRNWTVVDFRDVCWNVLSDMVLHYFHDHERFDTSAPECYFINGLSVADDGKTRIEHVTGSRVESMQKRYQDIIGTHPVVLTIVPKLLTLEQSSINTDLGQELEQQNRYYNMILMKQQELEAPQAMDQTQ